MEQEKICQEMETIMRQLSLESQRYLVELARAARNAEAYMEHGPSRGEPGKLS